MLIYIKVAIVACIFFYCEDAEQSYFFLFFRGREKDYEYILALLDNLL